MRVADSIRYLAKDIIKTYVNYVRYKVHEEDKKFIATGVDKDLEIYEDLFITVLGVLFNKEVEDKFDMDVVNQCAGVLDIMIEDSKYKKIRNKYADGVYDTCLLIYKKVEEGILSHA